MFFDNEKYFSFVEKCRNVGINVPIIPGLKPITKRNQLTLLPKVFHVDIPNDFISEVLKCKNDDEVKEVGIEWCTKQSKDLISKGVPSIHYYSLMATESVKRTVQNVL